MDPQLQVLIDLQDFDTRLAALERESARLPKDIEALQTVVASARAESESAKARLEAARKSIRAKEKDLEFLGTKRAKSEARLYEIKTNKEYSAVLVEIDELKQEKSRIEEDILLLMEAQERVTAEIGEVDARLRSVESQGQADEAAIREKLRLVEVDLTAVRAGRAHQAAKVTPALLSDYERRLKALGGLALAQALSSHICAGCRMAIRPQALLEVRAQSRLLICESCGRYLYWRDA